MITLEIEEFAKILVQKVRDAAIQSCDMTFKNAAPSPGTKRWRHAAANLPPDAFAAVLIPDIVDATIFYLLHSIDEGLLKLSFNASNGKTIDLSVEGFSELAGSYMGSDEWRAKYAKERFVDDVSDLE